MLRKIFSVLVALIFAVGGFYFGEYVTSFSLIDFSAYPVFVRYVVIGLICFGFGIIGLFLSSGIIDYILKLASALEQVLQKVPAGDIICGSLGLILGLIIGNLAANALKFIPVVGELAGFVVICLFGFIGFDVGLKKREELVSFFMSIPNLVKDKKNKADNKNSGYASPKILDTSVIIDGRIAEIYASGFIEGTLIIPYFVLEELRHIADSSDLLKRNRGRRGLEILNKMRKDFGNSLQIYENQKGLENITEVDSKLVKLCQMLNAKILTNDYNLNRVSEFQGVKVLNINELANTVKAVVLPGEEMTVQIIKEGKESGQGVAYLEDGTMIVIEDGKKYVGENVVVVVTSALQTAAGRMIFAKFKCTEHFDENAAAQ